MSQIFGTNLHSSKVINEKGCKYETVFTSDNQGPIEISIGDYAAELWGKVISVWDNIE
jgi:hypothetical protein